MAEGNRIGPYRIFEAIGQGGMGVVYRARHVASHRAVALKTVRSADYLSLNGLRREILALTTIRHPGIVRMVDHGTHEGLPWYAMDLLEGETLRRFGERIWSPFRSQPTQRLYHTHTPTEETPDAVEASSAVALDAANVERPPAAGGELGMVLSIMRRVCATLAFLHGEGFINGDLKPENTLLVDGAPVLIDFGLAAHHPGGSGREWLEAQQAMWGTLDYMPPERIRGELVDARSDLYSVGCILYELIVGEPPFTGSPPSRMRQHQFQPPVPPSERVEGVPPDLDRTILKLLSKEMSDRFGYADEVATVLGDIAQENRRLTNYPPGRAYLYRPRFVGRSSELAQLVALRERAATGMGAFVLIGGESGVGKTRLAMELTRILPSSRMRVVTSAAAPLGNSGAGRVPPLHAVRSLLRAVADYCQEAGADATDRILGPRRSVLALYEPLLAHVPAHDALEPVAPLPVEPARQRLFRYLTETLTAFSQEKPLLWVLDDVGWADELSLAYLASMSRSDVENSWLFIVGTYRSEEVSDPLSALLELPHVSTLELERLDAAEVRTMIRDMLALPNPLERFITFVERQTEGNPFFVAEYLRAAVTDRILYRDQDAWCMPDQPPESGRTIESLPLPRALRDLVDRRLHMLSPAALQTGLAAAVLGRELSIDVLREVSKTTEETFAAALGELIRCQVLESLGGGEVRFAHDKLREVAYGQIPSDQLCELHSLAADALESRWSDNPDWWATLAHHHTHAQQVEQGARYLKLAADHARDTHANAEAIALYRAAIEQAQRVLLRLSADAAQWQRTMAELHEALGDVLSLAARRDEARTAYAEALTANPHCTPAQVARLHRKTGKTWEAQHQHDDALECYAQAERALPDTVVTDEDRDEWVQVRLDRLWVYYWLDRVPDMDALIEAIEPVVAQQASPLQKARFFDARVKRNLRQDKYVMREDTLRFARLELQASETSGDFAQILQSHFGLGFVLVFGGQPRLGAIELRKALDLATSVGDLAQQARCLGYLAVATRLQGLLSETEELAARSLEVSQAAGMNDYIALSHANQAWVAVRHGHFRRALKLARRAIDTWQGQLALVFALQWTARLPAIEACLQLGDVQSAIAYTAPLLAPSQQPLPGPASDALSRAIRAFETGDDLVAASALQHAVQLLKQTEHS